MGFFAANLPVEVGASGIYAELFGDVPSLTVPYRDEHLLAKLRKLRCWPVFNGYRGKPLCDLQAILKAARSLSEFVLANAESILEVEVNPFLAQPSGGTGSVQNLSHFQSCDGATAA